MCDLHEMADNARRMPPTAEQDRAYGRQLAERGGRIVLASCRTPTPADRLSAWFSQYVRVPLEQRLPGNR